MEKAHTQIHTQRHAHTKLEGTLDLGSNYSPPLQNPTASLKKKNVLVSFKIRIGCRISLVPKIRRLPLNKRIDHSLQGSPHCLLTLLLWSQHYDAYTLWVSVEQLTSGSCNDRSVMLCECCPQGGGLRRGGAAETRLLRLLQCGWRWHAW